MARTDTLPHFLTDVADAIRTKAGTSEPIQASDFDTEIENLPSGADLDEYFYTEITENTSSSNNMAKKVVKKTADIIVDDTVTSLSYAYAGMTYIESAPRVVCNNNVTNISYMFNNAHAKIFDFSGMDTSNVTDFRSFLQTASSADEAEQIIFGGKFSISKAFYLSNAFTGRKNLTSIDLSSWENYSSVQCNHMFNNCINLRHIDIRNMVLSTSTNYSYMFGASANNGVPDDCEIIVKNTTEKDWITSKFPRLTNAKTVEEYEAE